MNLGFSKVTFKKSLSLFPQISQLISNNCTEGSTLQLIKVLNYKSCLISFKFEFILISLSLLKLKIFF